MNEIDKLRTEVAEYFNGTNTKQELMNLLDLYECPNCNTVILDEDKAYYTWDTGEIEDEVCEQCREDAK